MGYCLHECLKTLRLEDSLSLYELCPGLDLLLQLDDLRFERVSPGINDGTETEVGSSLQFITGKVLSLLQSLGGTK